MNGHDFDKEARQTVEGRAWLERSGWIEDDQGMWSLDGHRDTQYGLPYSKACRFQHRLDQWGH